MSPDTPLFGRLTVGANRVSLGRGGYSILMIRAAEQLRKLRPADDTVIQLELCKNKLPDSTTFDRHAVMEHQLTQRVLSDPDAPSPFEGITVGRVQSVMASPEYEAYAEICDPEKRQGLNQPEIDRITQEYHSIARDCFPHFPKWIP